VGLFLLATASSDTRSWATLSVAAAGSKHARLRWLAGLVDSYQLPSAGRAAIARAIGTRHHLAVHHTIRGACCDARRDRPMVPLSTPPHPYPSPPQARLISPPPTTTPLPPPPTHRISFSPTPLFPSPSLIPPHSPAPPSLPPSSLPSPVESLPPPAPPNPLSVSPSQSTATGVACRHYTFDRILV